MSKHKIFKIFVPLIILCIICFFGFHIYNKSSPHYTFNYGDDTVTISLISKEKSDDYYTFTTNSINAFNIVHFCVEQRPGLFINQSVFYYNLNFNKQFIDENPVIYIARINKNEVVSVEAYTPFFVGNEFHSYEPYKSANIIQEYIMFADNKNLIDSTSLQS